MAREKFERRIVRIFREAGYSPSEILTIPPEEMAEVPGITVPNIRAVLYVQGLYRAESRHGKARVSEDALSRCIRRHGKAGQAGDE